jgi:glycosyltransferase involved in cell wall biosynthesis
MVFYAERLCAAMAAEGADVVLVTSAESELGDGPRPFEVQRVLRMSGRPTGAAPPPRGALDRAVRRVRRLARLGARGVRTSLELRRLSRHLRSLRADVVQFGSIEHAIEGPFLWALRRQGALLAAVVHEPEIRTDRRLRWAVDVALYRGVYRAFDVLLLHGEANRQRFAKLYPGVQRARLRLIEHGSEAPPAGDGALDLRARYGLPADAPTAVFFGRLLRSKGLTDLVDAFAIVRERRPDARLVIAGPPPRRTEEGEVEQAVRERGLEDVVAVDSRYLPNEEVRPLMELASVVVLPYTSATQSGVLHVAYACGRPVIATRVGGLPEVVEEGGTGLLVPPGSPRELADAIVAMLDDPEGTARMGERARHLAETRFSWRSVAREVLAVYRELRPAA